MIKFKTFVDEKCVKEYSGGLRAAVIALFVIGVAGVIAPIVINIITGVYYDLAIYLSLIVMTFAVVFYIVILRNNKKIVYRDIYYKLEFEEGFMTVARDVDGEVKETKTVNYNEIYKVRETKSFYFVYTSKTDFFAVGKRDCHRDERQIVRDYLKSKRKQK